VEDRQTKEELEHAAVLVEDVIRRMGLEPDRVRISLPEPSRGWSLMRGSAAVAVFVRPPRAGEDSAQLRVVAPIIRIAAGDPQPLFRALLELNAGGLGAVSFGVQEDRVVVVAERRTLDLERAEVEFLIHRVGAVGDHYDDELIARFGGTRITDPS
jgi:uncharacterized protein (DUF1786 family)